MKNTPEIKITDFLDSITEETNDNEITVVPLMCGTGKSSYISHKMSDVIKANGKSGLLIVTDSIERMKGYNNPFDDAIRKFIAENSNQIITMTASNVGEAMHRHKNKPILIISTQRYFRLTRLEIIELLTWRNGKRCLVMFDEKPYLTEQVKITIKTFTDIDADLQMAIDDTADQTEKTWAINQWQMLERRMQSIMDGYEGIREGQFSLFHKDVGCMTTDDERFMRIIESNRIALNAKDCNAYTNICAIRQLTRNGAIYSCRKRRTGEYEKCFTVLVDHRDKLLGLGAKVIILDATGDISPDYVADYVRILPCTQFKRNLPNLTINIVNVSTSQRNMATGNAKKHIDAILDYLKNQNDTMESSALFTYKEVESRFMPHFPATAHFGNIKGRNDFRDFRSIVQVGLNRCPPIYYYLLALAQNKDEMNLLSKLSKQESLNYLTNILSDPKSNSEIMNGHLLADIEQNLFRSAIRNPENREKVNFTVLFNTAEYSDLVEMIKKRYTSLGATVNVLPAPRNIRMEKIVNRNNSEASHAQKIINWIAGKPKGTEFKLNDMLSSLDITNRQFDKAKERNSALATILRSMRSTKRGYYRVA